MLDRLKRILPKRRNDPSQESVGASAKPPSGWDPWTETGDNRVSGPPGWGGGTGTGTGTTGSWDQHAADGRPLHQHPRMAPKVVEFSVDTTTTGRSGEVWLTWSVIAAHSVRISELGKVPPSGKRSVTLTKPVRFQLEAWNDQGLVSAATDRVDVIELPTLDQHPLPIPTLSGVLTTPDLESVGPVPVIPPQLATRSAPLAVPIPALAFADDELRIEVPKPPAMPMAPYLTTDSFGAAQADRGTRLHQLVQAVRSTHESYRGNP